MTAPPRSWDKWFWNWLVKELDKAGYRLVKKPELTDKGLTAPRKEFG